MRKLLLAALLFVGWVQVADAVVVSAGQGVSYGGYPGLITAVPGLQNNGKCVSDGASTASSQTVTSATFGFTQFNVGQLYVNTSNTTQAVSFGVIASVQSATSATLVSNAQATIAGGNMCIGTDNTAIIAAALAVAVSGQTVQLPYGVMMLSAHITVPDTVRLLGQCHEYPPTSHNAATKGSVLMMAGTDASGAVVVGVSTSAATNGRAVLECVSVDGSNINNYAVVQSGYTSQVRECYIGRGLSAEIHNTSIGGDDINNLVFTSFDQGSGIFLEGAFDNLVQNNLVRGYGVGSVSSVGAGIKIGNSGAVRVIGNHVFQTTGLTVGSGVAVYATLGFNTFEITIMANEFDGSTGAQIRLFTVGNAPAIWAIAVVGNFFYEFTGFPDATYPIVDINSDNAASAIEFFTFTGNVGDIQRVANTNWTAVVANSGIGSVFSAVASGNAIWNANAFSTGGIAFLNNIAKSSAGTNKLTNFRGKNTLAGNGALTVFTVAHQLDCAPAAVTSTLGTALAAPAFAITVDTTNITFTFATAPPGNTIMWWIAQC